MDTRTLEQVISEASSSYDITKHGTRSQAIAAAVRMWILDTPGAGKEWIDLRNKAAKYDALRERFPYLPGDEFWTYLQGAIRKWSVCEVWIGGEEILCKGVANGKQSPVYRMHECHHTADACRAAIPVEE